MSQTRSESCPKPGRRNRTLQLVGSLLGGLLLVVLFVLFAPTIEEPRTIENPRNLDEVRYNVGAAAKTHEANINALRRRHAVMMMISIGIPAAGGAIAIAQWRRKKLAS